MRSEAHLYLVRVQLLRGSTAAALLAAAAMEGSSPAEEQAAWAAICLAALTAADHSGVQSCLTHLRGQTLLHGSAVLGGGPLWPRICSLLATVAPQAEATSARNQQHVPGTAASSPAVSVNRGAGSTEPPETPCVTSSLAANAGDMTLSEGVLEHATSAAAAWPEPNHHRSKRALRGAEARARMSARKASGQRGSPSSSQGRTDALPGHLESHPVVEVEESPAGSSEDDADYDSRLLQPGRAGGVQHPAVAQLLRALSVVVAREPSDPSFRDTCLRVMAETMLLHGFVEEACALACTSTSADTMESVLHKGIAHHLSLGKHKPAAAAARRLVQLGRSLSMEALAGLITQLQVGFAVVGHKKPCKE